jgi:hypothetical protein
LKSVLMLLHTVIHLVICTPAIVVASR